MLPAILIYILRSESCTSLRVLLLVLVLPVTNMVFLHQTVHHTRREKTYCKFCHNLLYICFPITFCSRHELKANSVPISTRVMGIPGWHTLHPLDMWTCKIDALCVLSSTDCPNWMISVLPSSVWLHWSLSDK